MEKGNNSNLYLYFLFAKDDLGGSGGYCTNIAKPKTSSKDDKPYKIIIIIKGAKV